LPTFRRDSLKVEMPDRSLVKIPYFRVEGDGAGPTFYVQAAQHGIELTGIYTVRLLLNSVMAERLNGTLIAVPIANPLAVRWRRHFYKMEPGEPYSSSHPHQMNRLWPGNPERNETERLAYSLYTSLVEQSDYVVDLHCWEQWVGATAIAMGWDPLSIELAEYSLLPFTELGFLDKGFIVHKDMLSAVATEAGKHALIIEHSGQRWVVPEQAKLVSKGLVNILRWLGMLPGEAARSEAQLMRSRDSVEVYAPEGEWIIITLKRPGEAVEKGDVIARLLDMESLEEKAVESPVHGLVYWIGSTRPNADTRPSEEVQVTSKGEKYRVATICELK